jgi:8-oxo-dGTP pyrophosphatase MutT (NUDIX family)
VIKHFDKLYDDARPIASWLVDNYERLRGKEKCHFRLRYSGVFLETRDGKLIFQRRDSDRGIAHPGKLSVFGGRAEGDETPAAAAIRELREETSLQARSGDLMHVATLPYVESEPEQRCMICTYYILRGVDPARISVREGAGTEAFTVDEALAQDDLTALPRVLLEKRNKVGQWSF